MIPKIIRYWRAPQGHRLPVTRREERRYAKRYRHHGMSPWRTCMTYTKRPCLWCMWRTVTGQHKRALAAHLVHVAEMRRRIKPIERRTWGDA